MIPAKVPPCPAKLEVLDVVEDPVEFIELIVLRLLAIREMDGPASAKTLVFDSIPLYWISNGNCQRLAVVCSKLRLKKDAVGDELAIAWS